jgi:multidrug efflux pump subunit AcrA (membrane-fusion protein)
VSFLTERAPVETAAPRARLLVPKAAVRSDAGRDVVFVVHDDRVERRAVTAGAADGDQIEIVSGLTAGEKVVVDAPAGMKDGDKVTVKER